MRSEHGTAKPGVLSEPGTVTVRKGSAVRTFIGTGEWFLAPRGGVLIRHPGPGGGSPLFVFKVERYGNETIRVTPDGGVCIKLPAPLAHLATARHSRYVLAAWVAFTHGGNEWADRIEDSRAVAYHIHLAVARGRWSLTASWQKPVTKTLPLEAARAAGMIGVDTNADHFAAYLLDAHGNPVGNPHRFLYGLTGPAGHRDAQVRHAITQLLHWANGCGVKAIGLENLDFAAEKAREKHGRKKRFRQLISGIPTGKLKARLVSMDAEQDLTPTH